MSPAVRLHLAKLILWAVPLAGLACGGDGGTGIVLPSLRITTVTTGVEVDPDGYSVSIDGQAAQAIGPNATLTVDQIADGPHTIELSGIAGNCAVGGQNPGSVSVVSGATATLAFVITCSSGAGSVQVVTTTSGSGTDPDGFALLLDGADQGPIGVNATSSLTGLAAGSHTIGLTGLAANCQVSGENPSPVSVPAGGTAQVAFAVACTAPGPATGNLEITTVTTGPAQDADGYLVSIDGGPSQPIGTSATLPVSNVSAAQHTVELLGLAANCGITGDNPIGAAVEPGETATVSFAVTCAATVGALGVTITGLPAGVAGAVTVSGPNSFSRLVAATSTLTALTPGRYAVSAENVVTGGTTYTPSVSRPSVDVVAGATAAVTVSYTGAAPVTLNLRIDGLYLTQSTQTYESGVPLVAGRPGYLRVFVLANESNTARPRVRVQFFRNGSSTASRTINAPEASVPTSVDEGVLGRSWNLPVEASLIQPGLSVVAEVDPADDIDEGNESDNRITRSLTVRTVPPAKIRFVSVQQGSGAPGNISNADQLMDLARRVHPLKDIDTDTRATVFPTTLLLEANGAGWDQLVSDIDALRVEEGSDRTYYGLVRLEYSGGKVGNAFVGVPSAIGTDNPADVARVVAHELGHTWGRYHSPCGNPGGLDPIEGYPYSGGVIGVYGFDVTAGALKPRSTPDVMGYCPEPWISDRTYQRVLEFRESNAAAIGVSARPQSSLLVWGRIVNGRPVLEPAFEIVTRPSLPKRPGPYSVSATGVDGSQLFTLSFDVARFEDNPAGTGHFAFAVPLDQASASRLSSLRLEGPTGGTGSSRTLAQLRTESPSQSIVARRVGENVSLRWNAAAHPMIMVRDPDTGEVLSFARGGSALVRTAKGELDLDISDGVRSQRVRLAVNRP